MGPRGRRRCCRRMSVPAAYQRQDHLCNARAALSVHHPRIIDGRAIGAWGSIFGARRGDHGCTHRCQRSSGPARQIGVMQDSAPSTASELGAVLGRGGKETDPHGVSSILWTHLVREPRRKTIRAQKKESDGGHLERSEALARRKLFPTAPRRHRSPRFCALESCNRRVCDRAKIEVRTWNHELDA